MQGKGAFGIRTIEDCAVAGCDKEGKARRCPYDGGTHSHGGIHYWEDYPKSALTFREGGWYLICDEHFAALSAERKAWEDAR